MRLIRMDGYARRSFLDRRQIKSSEGEFIWELWHSHHYVRKLVFTLSEIKFINNEYNKRMYIATQNYSLLLNRFLSVHPR